MRRARERVCVRESEGGSVCARESEGGRVCVCVRESEGGVRESVCVGERGGGGRGAARVRHSPARLRAGEPSWFRV